VRPGQWLLEIVADVLVEGTVVLVLDVGLGQGPQRRGDVRRAKLYFLRGREGKSARIKEKLN